MKSDVYKLDSLHDVEYLLSEVERIGLFCNLTKANSLKLRLLAEEMIGTADQLLEKFDNEFWIEGTGSAFTLHLKVRAAVNQEQKDLLIDMSSEKKNAATKGILGKISGVIESLIMSESNIPYSLGYESFGLTAIGSENYSNVWSMVEYQNIAPEKKSAEDWDGLEKSIIGSLADDVVIGVRSSQVEMVVKIAF